VSKPWQQYVPLVAGTTVVLAAMLLIGWYVYHVIHNKHKTDNRQVAQVVKIIRPPPDTAPPPPPPPPPEKVETPIEQPQEPQPDQAPQQALGIDADATAGGDSFGLAARPGGKDLIGTGTAPFREYSLRTARAIQDCLSAAEGALNHGSYRVNANYDISASGSIQFLGLRRGTGKSDIDELIVKAMKSIKHCEVGESRPLEMPSIQSVEIVAHG